VLQWLRKLEDAGCPLHGGIEKVACTEPIAGQYDPDSNSIRICHHVYDEEQVQNTITHELIHAYEYFVVNTSYCTQRLNQSDCSSIACSEVRAAAMSGDCNLREELLRGNWHWDYFQRCVRRRAQMATNMQPHCRNYSIETEFAKCFQDRSPVE
jgi:inner membrane protease ATP23